LGYFLPWLHVPVQIPGKNLKQMPVGILSLFEAMGSGKLFCYFIIWAAMGSGESAD